MRAPSGDEHRRPAESVKRGCGHGVEETLRELLRSNDPVQLSFYIALLEDQGIPAIVLDSHTSILEGSASAILQRLMVADDDHYQARRILRDAGWTFAD